MIYFQIFTTFRYKSLKNSELLVGDSIESYRIEILVIHLLISF